MGQDKCILVAEDDEDDFFVLRRGFEKAGLPVKLERAWNGEVAFGYLAGDPPFSDRHRYPLPNVILVDIKMPRVDGFDLLRRLQSRPELSFPVIVLSSSLLEADKRMAKGLGAREFVAKPDKADDYRELAIRLHRKWLKDSPPTIAAPRHRAVMVLRNFQTGEFLSVKKAWSPDHAEALNFEDHASALQAARELRLQDVELCQLNKLGDPVFGVRLDLE
jgi:CheY-like chemotaxis protein